METFGNPKSASKTASNYACEICDYYTSKKSNYSQHILSAKHETAEKLAKNQPAPEMVSNKYNCDKCNRHYSSKSGLWKHSVKCNEPPEPSQNDPAHLTNLIMKLIDQNQEQGKQIIELSKNSQTNIINNNNVNTNNNTSFNLNVYLNDTCKDALNINEFVDSLVLSVKDLEETVRVGYANGISKIFISGLQNLDVCKRPLHCSDVKRNTLYVKNANEWIKETEHKPLLTKAIKQVANKNIQNIFEWQKRNPEYRDPESKQNDRYNKLICETMSGSSTEEQLKNYEKIVSNVVKEVGMDKL
jgi:hypothetical protein